MTLATCQGGNKFTLSTTFLYSSTTAAPRPRDKTIQQTKRRKADTETQLTFSISVSSQSPNVFPISRPRISLAIHLLESLHSIQLPVYQHRLRRHQRPRLSNFLKPRALSIDSRFLLFLNSPYSVPTTIPLVLILIACVNIA